jgi:hypothetical protein
MELYSMPTPEGSNHHSRMKNGKMEWMNGRIEKWMNEIENMFVYFPVSFADPRGVKSP